MFLKLSSHLSFHSSFSLESLHYSLPSLKLHRTNPLPIRASTTSNSPAQQERRHRSISDGSTGGGGGGGGGGGDGAGIGAAAPTRGDVFLSRNLSSELVAEKPKTKSRKKSGGMKMTVDDGGPCCYGCGAPLQTIEADAPGFVDLEIYQLKKKHHQLRTLLCGRCKLLSHGHMLTAVGGHGGYAGGKQFVTAEELRRKLFHIRSENVLVVKLVDIVDFNGSFLAHIRDIVGGNPIILVITKVDLLPKGTDLNCVGDWVVEATLKKKLSVMSIHFTSSKSLAGIKDVAFEIQKERKSRDVYILGSANVGKSAFISALLQTVADKDPIAAAATKYKPMQSAVPGTTLGPIAIEAFLRGGKLYDTPGVHLHHRQAAVVQSEDLPLLAPQSRLRGQHFPAYSDSGVKSASETTGLNGYTIFWGGLVRVDVMKVPRQTRLIFFGPKALSTCMVPTSEADDFYKREIGHKLIPPVGKERVEKWPGLQSVRHLHIKIEELHRPVCDIAISGLGWIAIEPVSVSSFQHSDSNSEVTLEELHLVVHIPKPVEIFMRPPMPVGPRGAEWYNYPELTDKELELRPKLHI